MQFFPVFFCAAILLGSIASTAVSDQAETPKGTEPLKRLDAAKMSAILRTTVGLECTLTEVGSDRVVETLPLLLRDAGNEIEVFSRLPFQATKINRETISLSLPGSMTLGFLRDEDGALTLELLSSEGLLVGPCDNRTEIIKLGLSYFLPVPTQDSLAEISVLEKKLKDAEEAFRDQRSDFESQIRIINAESEAKVKSSRNDIKDLEDQLRRQKATADIAQQKANRARSQLEALESELSALFPDPTDLIAWRVVVAHPEFGYPMKSLSFQDLRIRETSALSRRCKKNLSKNDMERFNELDCIRILQRNLLPPSN